MRKCNFPCLPIVLNLFLFTAWPEDYEQAFCTSVPHRAVVPCDSTAFWLNFVCKLTSKYSTKIWHQTNIQVQWEIRRTLILMWSWCSIRSRRERRRGARSTEVKRSPPGTEPARSCAILPHAQTHTVSPYILTRGRTDHLRTLQTRHRASTCTRWHFAFDAMLSQQRRNPCTDCKSAQ